MGTDHEHRVCTYAEAEEAIRQRTTLHVWNCFCRTPAKEGKAAWAYCGHPLETCMGLEKPMAPARQITQAEALAMLENWKIQGHMFRFMADKSALCFCCSCGCGWFRDKQGNRVADPCDKSPFIEKTDLSTCNLCGACVKVCAYQARSLSAGKMAIDQANCYGCGACEFACPMHAISMVGRG